MLDEQRQNFDRIWSDNEFVMVRADVFGNTTSVMKLAEVLFVKTNRESFDALTRLLTHQRHDRTRINTPRQKRAERNFRHQPHPHRFAKNLDRALTGFFLADVDLLSEIRLPVTLGFDVAVVPAQPVTGFEFTNRAVGRERRGYAHEREVVIERLRFDVTADIGMEQEGTELRAKD